MLVLPLLVGVLNFLLTATHQDMTMASVITRSKPNCFNALLQLKRRVVQGQTLQEILRNYAGTKSNRLSILGMSPAESAAVVNLVHHLPEDAGALLEQSARQHGMFKGAFSHAFVAAQELRVGFEPSVVGPELENPVEE